MSLDITKVKDRLKTLAQTNSRTGGLWKPKDSHVVRIVPYAHNPDNPFIELYFHYGVGSKTYLSPISFGRPDPIEELSQKLKKNGSKDDWKMGKRLEPKMRTYVPIIVRGEENEGVKFWGFGKKVYEDILKIIADPDYGDITDPVKGHDLAVEFVPAENTGKSFPDTIIRAKPQQKPVSTDPGIIEKIKNQAKITDLFPEKTYEELNQILEDWLNDTPPADEAVDAAEGAEEAADKKAAPKKEAPASAKTTPGPDAPKAEGKPLTGDEVAKQFDDLFNAGKR